MNQVVALALLATVFPGRSAEAHDERPNILLIVTDDQRNDSLGCAGHPVLKTPVIDSVASKGVRFTNAFVTTPICAASRASILTGNWERSHGYTFGTPPLSEAQIARSYPALLRGAGYRTGFIGKYGVRAQKNSPGVMFDFFRSYGQPFLKTLEDGSKRHLTDITGDDALEFLEGCDGDQPFCLSVSFNAPHAEDATKKNPYPHSPEEAGLYVEDSIPSPRVSTEFWKSLPDFFGDSMHRDRWYWRWDTTEKYERFMRDYYRMISGIDRVTGRILEDLETRGLLKNTVVIFTGDNGYYMGSRGFAGKWSHYEESLRVPLVIHDPRVENGGRLVNAPALNVDLAPTVLDLAGVAVPEGVQGTSLVPLVEGDRVEAWREDFLFEHLLDNPKIPRMEGVRGGRFVYARYIDDLPEGEFLHDLEQDPLQLVNLTRDPDHAELLTRMRRRCDELTAAAGRAPSLVKGLFRKPPRAARPMVLWPWLNGFVDRDQLTRELGEMKAKGLRGPIVWDLGSLADPDGTIPTGPPFLGEDSVGSIHHVLEQAERMGLDVGVVASSSWNAGGPWIEPKLASQHLRWVTIDVQGPKRFSEVLALPDDVNAPAVDVAVLAVPGADAAEPGPPPIDVSGFVDETGRLTWDVPPGGWTILRMVQGGTGQRLVCPSPSSDGLLVDHMSAAATDRHFQVILDRLLPDDSPRRALKLLMLDSFEVWPRTDWTPGFIEEFQAACGYDPLPYLPLLAGLKTHEPTIAARFLHDYRTVVSRLMIDNHYGRAAEMLEARGLKLLCEAGHGGYPRVDPLEALGLSHIPTGEFWNGKQFWVTKEAASAAHIYGRRDVASESMTGWRHWRDGPEEYRRLFDLAFCAGLTSPVFHTFAHNPPEAGKPGFAYHAGEHFNVNSTWWNQAGPFIEYLSRCGHMLRQGQFVADVCFYYGDQAPNLVPSRRIDPKATSPHDPGECAHCGRPLPNKIDSLGPGYDFDYVNRDIIERDMQVKNGRVVLSSGMQYRMIVLPDQDRIALPVLQKLERLVRDGATLVGRPPLGSNSLTGYPACDEEVRRLARLMWGDGSASAGRQYGKGRVYPDVPLRDVMLGMGVGPDFTVKSPGDHQIDYIHRRTAAQEIFYVINSSDGPVNAECSFRVPDGMRPSLWNAEDGSVTPCPVFRSEPGFVRMPLHLPPVSSVFVVFQPSGVADPITSVRRGGQSSSGMDPGGLRVRRRTASGVRVRARQGGRYQLTSASGLSGAKELPAPPKDLPLIGPWKLEFPGGQGAPDFVTLRTPGSWTELEDEGARTFSGTARYTTTFDVPKDYLSAGRVLELNLGDVAEVAEISVNGKPRQTLWNAPYRADITKLLKPGPNTLEVRVTNLWHNRIVGDLRAPEAGAITRTNLKSRFRADMDLLTSGLLGPVTLEAYVESNIPLR